MRIEICVAPLWTCIKVLNEHIVCIEQSISILNWGFVVLLTLCVCVSLSPTLCIPFFVFFCCHPPEPVKFCFSFCTLSFTDMHPHFDHVAKSLVP